MSSSDKNIRVLASPTKQNKNTRKKQHYCQVWAPHTQLDLSKKNWLVRNFYM